MADTKWLDPANWTLADWEDATKRPLFIHLWDTLRDGAKERVAFMNQTHDSSFPENYTMPDYVTDNSIPLSSDYLKIRNAVWPAGLKDSKVMNNDDMVDGGTVTSNSDIPNSLTLANILNELGYTGKTKMMHDEDTSSGTKPALARMAWVKQWYEIMNFITWINRPLQLGGYGTTTSTLISSIEYQQYQLEVNYSYDAVLSSFNSAQANERYPTFSSSDTDIYTANDLNESAPFSSVQDVRDYAISKFDPDSATWNTATSGITILVGANQQERVDNQNGNDNVVIQTNFYIQRVRFKINDSYRATSPDRFTSDLYWFLYYNNDSIFSSGGTVYTFSDFGEGFADNENSLVKLTADGSGWYYLEPTPDFDTEAVLAPAVGNSANQEFTCRKRTITADMSYTDNKNSVYQKPNLDDGTAWEWYTPAP